MINVYVESGHGIKNGLLDPGAVGSMYKERDLNILTGGNIINKLRGKVDFLQDVGLKSPATLVDKVNFINSTITKNKMDSAHTYEISIHHNSIVDPKPSGFEVWYQQNSQDSKNMAQAILDAYKEYFPSRKIRGILPSSQYSAKKLYIDDLKCIAVLVECGFISNSEEQVFCHDQSDRIAECIAHGFLTYAKAR